MLNITDITQSLCSLSVEISVLVSMFQSLIVLSLDSLARIVPFVLNATDITEELRPLSVAISVLVSTLQRLIVKS